MTLLFMLAVLFCLYTYAIFPIVLHLRARHITQLVPAEPDVLPSVSVVIAAHNEQHHLQAKLVSLQQLNYPPEKLQLVIVSDGSTDNTLGILKDAIKAGQPLCVVHYDPAAGKPTALNKGVSMATGEVLVFMDARQMIASDAIGLLVSHLLQDNIGAVSGELVLTDVDGLESANVGLYWRYEKWIRQNESKLFSTTGATGALYAIRASDFIAYRADVLLDDFDTPISLLKKRQRTLFVPQAKAFDKTEASVDDEFKRKARTLAGNFQSFSRNRWLFSPGKNPVFWQFLSHKVFRLLVPYAMLIALLACVFGDGLFLKIMLLLQVLFYALGFAGLVGLDNKLTNFIKVFLQLNAAAVAGAIQFLTGKASVRWKADDRAPTTDE